VTYGGAGLQDVHRPNGEADELIGLEGVKALTLGDTRLLEHVIAGLEERQDHKIALVGVLRMVRRNPQNYHLLLGPHAL
jgi:hypothetical protein